MFQFFSVELQFTVLLFIDLQEFYEETLLDEQKSTQQKTVETLQIASRWELDPPIVASQLPVEVSDIVYVTCSSFIICSDHLLTKLAILA